MTEMFNMIWKEGRVPLEWRIAIIVRCHKVGSKLDCQQYRGISLFSVPGKVFARALNGRVKGQTRDNIMEMQCGFRDGRSCTDQICTLKQLMEKVIKKNKRIIVAFATLRRRMMQLARRSYTYRMALDSTHYTAYKRIY